MTKGDAVILLREGKRCIAFPGKGGYKNNGLKGQSCYLSQKVLQDTLLFLAIRSREQRYHAHTHFLQII